MSATKEHYTRPFFSQEDWSLGQEFMEQGYLISPVADSAALERIRSTIVLEASKFLGVKKTGHPSEFLNFIQENISQEQLNNFRLHLFGSLNRCDWLRSAYFQLASKQLNALIGNELAMQRNVNLSIQLPSDTSSLLPIHSDVWSGDSPFELVLWLPLVDCFRTKSMYILPPEANERHRTNFAEYATLSAEDLYQAVKDDLVWLEVPYGHCLLFTHTLMHGNVVNEEHETRWSMNCRFKSLFSPYSSKRLGEFFEPISIRPATRVGMTYNPPEGFSNEQRPALQGIHR